MLRPLPKRLQLAEGAAYGVTALTAWVALVRRGALQAGETLLVHGASGGTGHGRGAAGPPSGRHRHRHRQLGAQAAGGARRRARSTCSCVEAGAAGLSDAGARR